MDKTITVTIDTPGRKIGMRPSYQTELLQIQTAEISISCALQEDGSLRVVVHEGNVDVRVNAGSVKVTR